MEPEPVEPEPVEPEPVEPEPVEPEPVEPEPVEPEPPAEPEPVEPEPVEPEPVEPEPVEPEPVEPEPVEPEPVAPEPVEPEPVEPEPVEPEPVEPEPPAEPEPVEPEPVEPEPVEPEPVEPEPVEPEPVEPEPVAPEPVEPEPVEPEPVEPEPVEPEPVEPEPVEPEPVEPEPVEPEPVEPEPVEPEPVEPEPVEPEPVEPEPVEPEPPAEPEPVEPEPVEPEPVEPEPVEAEPVEREPVEPEPVPVEPEPPDEPERRASVSASAEGSFGVTFPDDLPKVMLVDVTRAQLESVLVELERSTAAAQEVARRVRAGELPLTLAVEAITNRAVGLGRPEEVHVQWMDDIQDVAATLIHEATHQADPMLASGGPRSQIEATARLAEFEYRASKGLEPQDAVESAYRVALDRGATEGLSRLETDRMAREAMIAEMRGDPARYGIEDGPTGSDGVASGLAFAPPPAFTVVQAEYDDYPDLKAGQVVEFPGGERVWRNPTDNSIVIRSALQSGVGRRGYEHALPSRGAYGLGRIHDHYMERAHSQGQGTGFEAPYAIRLAAEIVNQGYQNVGVEEFGRQLAAASLSDIELTLTTATKTAEASLRLEWIDYKVEVEMNGHRVDLFSFRLLAEGRDGMPEITEPWLTPIPELHALIELPEMDGMNARLRSLIAEERQRRGL